MYQIFVEFAVPRIPFRLVVILIEFILVHSPLRWLKNDSIFQGVLATVAVEALSSRCRPSLLGMLIEVVGIHS
jgi:hypothetical protein